MSVQDVIQEAARLAQEDDPLAAWGVLNAHGFLEAPEAADLVARLRWHLDHLQSREAYRAFYDAPAPERPFLPIERIATLDRTMMRAALIHDKLWTRGARSVLELGCYDGFLTLHLALALGIRGIGVDLAQHAIHEALRRATVLQLPCDFVAEFIEDFRDPRRFDAVLVCEVLEHVPDVAPILAVAEQHCAPGGHIYVSVPLDTPPHPSDRERKEHVRRFDETALRALFNADGRRETWYQQYRVPDGLAHMGSYQRA